MLAEGLRRRAGGVRRLVRLVPWSLGRTGGDGVSAAARPVPESAQWRGKSGGRAVASAVGRRESAPGAVAANSEKARGNGRRSA